MPNPIFPSRNRIAKIFGVDGDTFHDEVKDEIVSAADPKICKNLGDIENPDIGIDEEGFIWLSKAKDTRKAKKTDLKVEMFKREEKEQKEKRFRHQEFELLDEEE